VLGKPVGSSQNHLLPLQTITGRPQTSSTSQSHSIQAITDFRESKPLTAGSPKSTSSIPSYSGRTKTYFQAIIVMPKTTASIPSHSSRAKIDFWHSKSFQAGQNRHLPVQAIQVRPKLTSSIPSLPVRAKLTFSSKPFQSGQNRLPHSKPFQAIPVRPKLTSSIPGHTKQAKNDFLHFKPLQSGQNWLFPFQAIPVRLKPICSSPSYKSLLRLRARD
jgi:hypothetical protein